MYLLTKDYSGLHRFAASGAEGKTMNFLFIIEQQFRAKKSLLSDRIDNELLIINLATVWAEGILFPHLQQAVKRMRHPKSVRLRQVSGMKFVFFTGSPIGSYPLHLSEAHVYLTSFALPKTSLPS